MGKMVWVREKKVKAYEPGIWPEKKRLEVVTTYLALGSIVETARICNVPVPTIKTWKLQPWWKETIDSIQSGENQKTDNKMSKIIDNALDMLVKRIEEGDYQYDQKTGKLVKVPLKARDLERISSGLFDKRQLIRQQPTSIKADELNQTERLLKLAEQFAAFSGKLVEKEKVVNEFIDGEWQDAHSEWHEENDIALHDQRQERLQERVELGTLQEEKQSEG